MSDETSKFNSGYFQIQRLHNLWLTASNNRINGNLIKWRWVLDAIWLELSSDAYRLDKSKKQKNDYAGENDKYEKLIDKFFLTGKKNVIYILLKEREEFLRRLEDASGKGARYQEIITHEI